MWIATGYLDADEDIAYERHADACNCFGHSYKQWYRALARHPVIPEFTIWFPKLFENPREKFCHASRGEIRWYIQVLFAKLGR